MSLHEPAAVFAVLPLRPQPEVTGLDPSWSGSTLLSSAWRLNQASHRRSCRCFPVVSLTRSCCLPSAIIVATLWVGEASACASYYFMSCAYCCLQNWCFDSHHHDQSSASSLALMIRRWMCSSHSLSGLHEHVPYHSLASLQPWVLSRLSSEASFLWRWRFTNCQFSQVDWLNFSAVATA